jgi:hypothetical protein
MVIIKNMTTLQRYMLSRGFFASRMVAPFSFIYQPKFLLSTEQTPTVTKQPKEFTHQQKVHIMRVKFSEIPVHA